jgi:hypothetical protein
MDGGRMCQAGHSAVARVLGKAQHSTAYTLAKKEGERVGKIERD